MNEVMTVREVLEITRNNLANIAVPRSLNQMIGIPIDQAIGNINACIEAMDRQEAQAKEAEQTGDGQLSEAQEALLRHARECFGTEGKDGEADHE